MNETVIVGLIAGFFGVLAAAIPAYLAQRKSPSRLTTDAVTLVDASGEVISNLTDEIARLERLAASHAERADALAYRVGRLEEALRKAGIDPLLIQ